MVHVDSRRLPKQHTSKVCMLYIVEENAFTQNYEEHRVMFFLSDIQWIAFIGISSVMSYPVEQEEMILFQGMIIFSCWRHTLN